MIVVVCLDDQNGMFFNNRRQSRDRKLIEDLIDLVGDRELWMAPYSLSLFPDTTDCHIVADKDFLEQAEQGDYAFVEDQDVNPYLQKTEGIVIYRWNRRYPNDMTFTVDLGAFDLSDRKEFPGYSHEVITREIYVR